MSLVDSYYQDLIRSTETITLLSALGSPLHHCGLEILEMIASYLSDAATCEIRQDTVNQLASMWYAHGWLAGGCFIGLIHDQEQPELLILPDDTIPPFQMNTLKEKTHRYQQMLESALSAITTAPAKGSPLAKGSDSIRTTVMSWLNLGKDHVKADELAAALACYCFGYGLLDAAIRSGFFCMIHSYHLFTTEP